MHGRIVQSVKKEKGYTSLGTRDLRPPGGGRRARWGREAARPCQRGLGLGSHKGASSQPVSTPIAAWTAKGANSKPGSTEGPPPERGGASSDGLTRNQTSLAARARLKTRAPAGRRPIAWCQRRRRLGRARRRGQSNVFAEGRHFTGPFPTSAALASGPFRHLSVPTR